MSTPPPPIFTKAQRVYIRKAIGVAVAGLMVLIVALQVQVAGLNDRVNVLEGSSTPTSTPTASPSTTPSASSSATPSSPTPTPTPSSTPTTSPSTSATPPTPTPTTTPTTPAPIPLPGPEPSGPGQGVFSATCKLDHSAPDDPIVFFGQPGAAHLHDFFGAIGVSPTSTPDELRTADATTCTNPGDTAAYWAPSLISSTGVYLKPTNILAYYRAGSRPVRAFPQGLKMIADLGGDPDTGFSCSDQGPFLPEPMNCPSGGLKMHIHFPMYWDGIHLDSPDHRSHMSFTKDLAHPIELVHLSVHVQYGIKNGSNYHIGPNPIGTFPVVHADFMMSWQFGVLENIIRDCVNAGHDCKKDATIGN